MIEPLRPTRAKNVPITDARIEIPPIAIGYRCKPEFGNVVIAINITATAVTAYVSKRSAAIPAQSPTLSPTLSAITAGLRGSSSGIPASILPTMSAPTSAALVKMPPPRRANTDISEPPKPRPRSASTAVLGLSPNRAVTRPYTTAQAAHTRATTTPWFVRKLLNRNPPRSDLRAARGCSRAHLTPGSPRASVYPVQTRGQSIVPDGDVSARIWAAGGL